MGKIFISLFLIISIFSQSYPCGQSFILKKVSVIITSIIKRLEKQPLDFSEAEIKNTVSLYHSEYAKTCLYCRVEADRNYFHYVVNIQRHIKIYKLS